MEIEKEGKKSLEEKLELELEYEVTEFANDWFQDSCKDWICIWMFKICYISEVAKNY